MRRKRRKAFSIIGWLAVFWLSFSLLAVQTEAASFPNVERLEQHAAQLERAMKANQWSKPYRLFNQVKRDYEAAKKEVARVRPQTARAQLEKRIAAGEQTMKKASAYISAVESGERLRALTANVDRALRTGDVDVVYDSYALLQYQIRKTAILIGRVPGAALREKMEGWFQRPALAVKLRAYDPINIMKAMDKLLDAYDEGDIARAERLLSLCDRWLPNVVDAATRKQLAVYIDDFKAPVVLDVDIE